MVNRIKNGLKIFSQPIFFQQHLSTLIFIFKIFFEIQKINFQKVQMGQVVGRSGEIIFCLKKMEKKRTKNMFFPKRLNIIVVDFYKQDVFLMLPKVDLRVAT